MEEEEEKKLVLGRKCPLGGGKNYLETYDLRRKYLCCGCGYFTNNLEENQNGAR